MMMKKILSNPANQKKIAAALAVVALAAGGTLLYRNITAKPEPARVVPLVRTVTVGATAAEAGSVYPGEVRGRYESQLAFQVAGKINARLVNTGDRVTNGQVLLTLDPKDVNQSVEAADAQLASAAANHKLAADNAARYNSLYAQGAVSEAVRDQYNTQLEAASAALRQAQAQANVSGNQLGYTQLVSDADGVISSISTEIGQVVAAGTPIVTVVRSGQREIHINVPEDAHVQLGQPAQVSFWALPGITASGTVREIAPMADPVTRTYKVCIAVPDLPAEARLGMTARVTLLSGADGARQLVLPANALYQVSDKPQVWLVRDKRVQLTDIKIAGYDGNRVRVAAGLAPGDVVVTAGLNKLTPGQEVRLEEGGEQ